jgi:hypothetical protein
VNGALRDPVDGGFYRRCIDEAWKEPYFQKTLADQARIALALFDAADAAKDDKLRAAGIAALDFVLKELRNPDGTFAAALDGTLEENPAPTKRPKFVKVGSASTASIASLTLAMRRSGEVRLTVLLSKKQPRIALPTVMLLSPHHEASAHAANSDAPLTAADWLGTIFFAGALEQLDIVDKPQVLQSIVDYCFDPTSGGFMATPAKLPPGIAVRVPASGETPSAEVLALLAGVDTKTADLICRNLMHQIEYDELPPGDILLGLSVNR